MIVKYTVKERFLRYVQIDTQADAASSTSPSTKKQKNLSLLLIKELKSIGINDAQMTEHGYVYATIPSNTSKKNVPTICFCAHVDTAPDASGTDVKPILHKNYQGQDIILPDDTTQVIRLQDYPYLENLFGHDIITASGLTLLGSDDKAGIAEIMDLSYQLKNKPQIKHGTIRILFTTDEEIGRGVDHVDLKKLDAQVGYTLDGGSAGDIENETFSADGAVVTIQGVSVHPGYAKGKMENAIKIAAQIVDALPRKSLSPESTSKHKGFIHPVKIEGALEEAKITFILRDFYEDLLEEKGVYLRNVVDNVMRKYPNSKSEVHIFEQYRNMKTILDQKPEIVDYAMEAVLRAGIKPRIGSIRGGTDGSRLSFMGLPCPNLFAGQQAIHSRHEFISVQDMQKAVETMIHLCQIWEENTAE